MQNTFIIDADIKKESYYNQPTVTANDDITLIINVTDDGIPFDLTGVVTFSLANTRQDKQVIVTTGTKTGTNQVTFVLGTSETAISGKVKAVVQLYDADERVSTLSFSYKVEADPTGAGYTPSSSEQTLIQTVLGDGPLVIQSAQDAAAYANTQGDYALQVADENKTTWLVPVATIALRDSTYPTPAHGDQVRVTDLSEVYRYETVRGWFVQDKYDATTIDNITAQLAEKANSEPINAKIPPPPFNGAKGDNVTDDSTVLNALFEYGRANNRKVRIPHGVYKCVSQILSISCDVEGAGDSTEIHAKVIIGGKSNISKLKLVANSNGVALDIKGTTSVHLPKVVVDDVTITFEGTTTEIYRESINAGYVDRLVIKNSSIMYGINLANCPDFEVINNTVDGDNYKNNSELLHITLKSSGKVHGNTFKNTGDDFIDLYSAGEQVIITKNKFFNCKSKWGQGIEIKVSLSDNTANTSSVANGFVESIIIADNIFKGFYPPSNSVFRGVNIYRIDNRATPVVSLADCPKNILIDNNIFEGYTDSDASITSAFFEAISVISSWGVEVTNNTVRDINTKSATQYRNCGLSVNGSKHVKVYGNTFNIKNGSAMNLYNNNSDLDISHNKSYEDYTLGHKTKTGIYIRGYNTGTVANLTNSKIKDNSFDVLESSFRAYVSEATVSKCDVSDNSFTGGIQSFFNTIVNSKLNGNFFNLTALIGDATTISKQNSINGNHCTVTTMPGMELRNVQASQVKDNQFVGCNSAIKLYGTTKNNLIKDNLSSEQTTATTVWNIDVLQADYDTNTFVDNKRVV